MNITESLETELPPEYDVGDGRTTWPAVGRDGCRVAMQLANCEARITEEVVLDDGIETTSDFRIEATVGGAPSAFTLPADRFASLAWIEEELGPRAILELQYQLRDRIRATIQCRSRDGALGASGLVVSVVVEPVEAIRPPEFTRATDSEQLCGAILASQWFLRFVPPRVIYPPMPRAAGWQTAGGGLRPSGVKVGRLAVGGIYLEPTVALNVVRRQDPAGVSVTAEARCRRLFDPEELTHCLEPVEEPRAERGSPEAGGGGR